MENQENVTNVTENVVEQPTEEVVEGIELTDTTETNKETPIVEETKEVTKKYDDDDLDKIIARKLAKQEAKIRKEYEEKLSTYKDAEMVLTKGLDTEDITEATQKAREFYKEQGIIIPEATKPGLSEREIEILAKADAEDIIEDGIEEMTKERENLLSEGIDPQEKAIAFKVLNQMTQNANQIYEEEKKKNDK